MQLALYGKKVRLTIHFRSQPNIHSAIGQSRQWTLLNKPNAGNVERVEPLFDSLLKLESRAD
jgi:hypothetical protein